jgi:hypothetical protein
LGLLATAPEPKANFQEFIDDLDAAGIRFALLSPAKELASKAFAERLGLETDWNSCILLSAEVSGYSALSDIKARLPHGVSAIRPHLQHVDDIPLHVSIFAECEPSACAEMIQIYQEAGDVVGVVGSARAKNAVFEGDFFICYDLFDNFEEGASFDELAKVYLERFRAHLALPATSSPYILTELIRESRTILHHSRSAWEFFCGVALCFSFLCQNELSCVLMTALVSFSICFGAHDSGVLKTHPLTRTGSLPFWAKILRFAPFVMVAVMVSGRRGDVSVLMMSTWMQSLAFLHPVRPFSRKQLADWKILSLHGISFLIFCLHTREIKYSLLAAFISSLLFFWQEWMKKLYLLPMHVTLQKRSKLLFSTKLGMHSPV